MDHDLVTASAALVIALEEFGVAFGVDTAAAEMGGVDVVGGPRRAVTATRFRQGMQWVGRC